MACAPTPPPAASFLCFLLQPGLGTVLCLPRSLHSPLSAASSSRGLDHRRLHPESPLQSACWKPSTVSQSSAHSSRPASSVRFVSWSLASLLPAFAHALTCLHCWLHCASNMRSFSSLPNAQQTPWCSLWLSLALPPTSGSEARKSPGQGRCGGCGGDLTEPHPSDVHAPPTAPTAPSH